MIWLVAGCYRTEEDVRTIARLLEKGLSEWRRFSGVSAEFRDTIKDDHLSYRRTIHEWHKDGVIPQEWPYMIVWATENPTQVLLPNMEVYQPEPFQAMLLDNRLVQHRRPPGVPGRNFYRISIRDTYPFDEIQQRLTLEKIR